ncbi:hypothetical protein MVES1_002702 [Malassezia vespertilionis]|uniref:RRM domain-containing protein n=1 Tax=Malassezia vespertilionis TaxID=2020962 RepID=A0A2N1JAY0_9BASI|nr:uncharacterized protein MVES1_002702 [Malassezia vespertilionis]PKI83710.1 hypothetical protein MVES_002553 [Malassezia vespertilionis]WFD07339.1 hypothetical protein MVES1_002702 [Malassezia vespertilionis]
MSSLVLSLPVVSPLATRVLELSGFSPLLRTHDLYAVVRDAGAEEGSIRVKWHNDTTAYVVFQDPSVAKLVYIRLVCAPPALLLSTYLGEDDAGTAPPNAPQNSSAASHASAQLLHTYAAVRPCRGQEADLLIAAVGMSVPERRPYAISRTWDTPTAPDRGHPNERGFGHRRLASGAALPNKPMHTPEASGAPLASASRRASSHKAQSTARRSPDHAHALRTSPHNHSLGPGTSPSAIART